ncbi:Gamma-crystallin-4 [Orchesella cincta]|uniref:Gamma-crystallin-4 n=1 Tax=Orchesella cincta TaxID=48709 RepID=A0A1D2MT74_ORCCI|nr:Gamma-crystallin-4 [Orchesella cincta]
MAFNSASIVLIGLIAGAIPLVFCQLNQRAVLYDDYNGQGEYMVVPEQYVDDLSVTAFDNRVRSVCVTGIWLLYQDALYNSEGPRGMEYVFGRDNYCTNVRTIPNAVSSLRFAGAPKDFSEDTFTLYKYDYFQGEEEYTLTALPNLNLVNDHASIIISGRNNWTVFDQPNYSGNRICLAVPEQDIDRPAPAFISDLTSFDIPHGSIKSVRKGCIANPSSVVNLSSFARAGGDKNAFVQSKTCLEMHSNNETCHNDCKIRIGCVNKICL